MGDVRSLITIYLLYQTDVYLIYQSSHALFLVNISDVNAIQYDALVRAGKASAKKALADSQIDEVIIVAALEGVKKGIEEAVMEVDDGTSGMYMIQMFLFYSTTTEIFKKTLSGNHL